jgi:hypothetical protein
MYIKETAESGVHPKQNTSDSGVRNFYTFIAAHLL